jgi:hypothetical protein
MGKVIEQSAPLHYARNIWLLEDSRALPPDKTSAEQRGTLSPAEGVPRVCLGAPAAGRGWTGEVAPDDPEPPGRGQRSVPGILWLSPVQLCELGWMVKGESTPRAPRPAGWAAERGVAV